MTDASRPSRLREDGIPEMRGYAKRRSDKRGYTTPAGVLPSVTTILGATSKGKARLEAWLKQPNAEAVSADARRRGTWLHSQVEGWIEGAAPRRGFGGGLQAGLHGAYWRNMQPWLETHFVEALAIEKPIWHPKGLSGTFDCLGYAAYGGEPEALTLMDWKTAQRERQGDLLEDYFCQLAAYRLGITYCYGLRPERALLVIARPHSYGPDVHELSCAQLDEYEAQFLKRVEKFYATGP